MTPSTTTQTTTPATMPNVPNVMAATTNRASEAAIDWLAGRMRWERILRALHDRAEGTEAVVPRVELVENPEPATASEEADAA